MNFIAAVESIVNYTSFKEKLTKVNMPSASRERQTVTLGMKNVNSHKEEFR